ncbi:MAG: EGF domain-containing protein [bacterium]
MVKKITFTLIFSVAFFSCVTDFSNLDECITAFDCSDGEHCIDGTCVATGDNSGNADSGNDSDGDTSKDTSNTGDSAGEDTNEEKPEDSNEANEHENQDDSDKEGDEIQDFFVTPDEDNAPDEDETPDEDEEDLISCLDGYELIGNKCVDIDECAKGLHNCHKDAECTNTEGGFSCKCKPNYAGDGVNSCVAGGQNANCSSIPDNAVYNTVYVIVQTWNGSDWAPGTTSVYSETPSTTECRFKCDVNYTWDGKSCNADKKHNQGCIGLPLNAVWNTASMITQSWNGSIWTPSTTGVYNEESSTTECRYKCVGGYHKEGDACVSDTRTDQPCGAKPANTDWNTVSKITQTWSGGVWSPTTTSSYSTAPSETECRFVCKINYNWNGSACLAATKEAACDGKPENTDWNDKGKNGFYTQTWNGSSWQPVISTTYSTTAGDCRYICSSGFHYEGGACVSNTRTNQSCSAKPANTDWNTVSEITQTWNGSNWVPSTTSTHSETPSTTECRYKCIGGFHYEGGACISNTRTNQSCSAKPANTEWNTVSKITQTWSGGVWNPTTISSYSTTPSETECRYKCATSYHWNSSQCVECTENSHCAVPDPYCNPTSYTCVECLSNNHCNEANNETCINNKCVECTPQTWPFTYTSTGRTGTIQSWTAPDSGTYRIIAMGAQGGHDKGGFGAKIVGTFEIEEGTTLSILVGHRGDSQQYTSSSGDKTWYIGGGGGSFVVKQGGTTNSDIYIIAGGGGGASDSGSKYDNRHGSASTSGNSGVGSDTGSGGTDGNGGKGKVRGSGGGGFFTKGEDAGKYSLGGYSFLTGGIGGEGKKSGGGKADGGFGGGGGIGGSGFYSYSGGGGGYSGGGGGGASGSHCGGGGGSYNSGTNQENVAGNKTGPGFVQIDRICE